MTEIEGLEPNEQDHEWARAFLLGGELSFNQEDLAHAFFRCRLAALSTKPPAIPDVEAVKREIEALEVEVAHWHEGVFVSVALRDRILAALKEPQ